MGSLERVEVDGAMLESDSSNVPHSGEGLEQR